jgi:hypothetical protein
MGSPGVDSKCPTPDTIDCMVVQEGRDARIILGRNFEHQTIPRLEDDARRPDFNLDRHDRPRFQVLELVMGVIWPVKCRPRRLELAMGGTQPAAGGWDTWGERSREGYLSATLSDFVDDGEEICIVRRG